MPIASWSDIVETDPVDQPPVNVASFDDIAQIHPALAPAPNVASFADIAEVHPFSPLEAETIAASPASAGRTMPDQAFALPPVQPTVEPPAGQSLMDAVRKSAPGRFVAGAAVPVTSIVRGGMALGKNAADQIRTGGVAAVPGAVSSIVTGAARDIVEPAVSAIVPPIMQRKPGEAALGTVDQVIPLQDIAHRVQGGDYAGAAGEVLSTAALIAGPHAAERLRRAPVEGVPVAEKPPVVAGEIPPEAAPAPRDVAGPGAPLPQEPAAPKIARVEDIVAVEPPAAPVSEPPKVARFEDVVAIEPPPEAPPQTAHVRDVVEVMDTPQTSAADEPRPVSVRRFTTLDADRAAVQDRAATAVETDTDGLASAYREKFGNVVSADSAKELFPDYATKEQRTANDVAVHRPASALAQHLYEDALKQPVAEGHEPYVVLTAGGTGSGKTSSLHAALPDVRGPAHVVYDSTLTDLDAARSNIEAAKAAGKSVTVVFTDREVSEAFRATLDRAVDQGRPVTVNTHLTTHLKAPEVFDALRKEYAADPDVTLAVVRNSAKGRELVPAEAWEPRRYNEADVRAHLARILEEERPRLSEPLADAVAGATKKPAPAKGYENDAGEPGRVQPDPAPGRPAEDARGTREVDEAEIRSMPDSRRRADPSGALVPSPASRALSLLKPGEKQMRPSEIVRDLSKSLDELPIRVGKFKQQALGIYKVKPQTIRLKVANDLDTLAHELGHHIHESLLGGELPKKSYRGELEALGLPTSRSSYSLDQKLAEGQAEFTRLYLSDPAAAQNAAPVYYQAFETGLEQHPELAAVLQRAQRHYVGHLALDPVERAMSHLDFDGRDASPKADLVTRLQANMVDDLHPLKKMVDDLAGHQPIDFTKSGYVLARLARGASAKADGFLRHGVRSPDGTFVAPALEPALKPVRKQIKEFATYLAAQRAIELRGRGMETGMTLGEARATVAKFQSPTFDMARDAVYAYQDGLLNYAREHGTLSADQLAAIKQVNKAYVPFQRVLDDVGAISTGAKRGLANQAIPVKRIKGSGRDVINPLESIVKNTHTLVSMVEQNRAMQALVDQATSTKGGGRYLEAIPEKQVATMFNLGKLAKDIKGELDAAGVDYPDNLDFDKLVTVFTPTQMRIGERGVVSVLRDGKRQWFQVNDPAVHEAIAAIGPQPASLIIKLMRGPASLLRAGATTTVGFIARNPIRDTFEASVNSRYGFKPVVDTARGLFEYAKKGEDYEQFMNSGAGNSALVSMDRNRVREELGKMDGSARRKLLSTVVHGPVDLLRGISEAMEQATRLGEFKKAIESEGRTAEGYARAALAARDVTLDFARGGTSLRQANQVVAFLNAGVQGMARTKDVFQQNPVRSTVRALTYITAPTLIAYAVNRHDPSYNELPAWERASFWHIPIGQEPGHRWVRIPKPIGLGNIFGTVPQAAAEYLDTKDRAPLDALLPSKDAAWRELVSMTPNVFLPIVESVANYDFFRQRAIVNPDDTNLDTELQYNRWTSDLAKFVGPKIGIAPAKLDHLVYGYGGGLAAGVVSAVDQAGEALGVVPRKKPAAGIGGVPLASTFVRETAGADAASLQDFYKLRDRVEGTVGSIKRYEKAGDADAADKRRAQAVEDLQPDADATIERVHTAAKELTELRDGVNEVFASKELDPNEKKELLDRLYEQMVNVSRAALLKPELPSRFTKPIAPALQEKLDTPVKPSAPSGRPAGVESRPSAPGPARPTVATPPPRR